MCGDGVGKRRVERRRRAEQQRKKNRIRELQTIVVNNALHEPRKCLGETRM